MEPSKYQQEFYDFVENGEGNGLLEAVAGSGKTTTIVAALRKIPMTDSALVVAFNKHIATELAAKVPMHAEARTLHSFGMQALRQATGRLKVNANKDSNIIRFELLQGDQKKQHWARSMSRLISIGKSNLLASIELANRYMEIAERLDINMPKFAEGQEGEYASVLQEAYEMSIAMRRVINFDDMLHQPIYYDIPLDTFDHVFVDEFQDLNALQIEMVRRISVAGRCYAVGDRHQAIYGFRGAEIGCIEGFIEDFDAKVMPLSICYRCSKAVVERAQEIVPHIQAAETAIDGNVGNINKSEFFSWADDGDFVLCRTTAPLVKECLAMIASGRKAIVKGREIGAKLIETLEDVLDNNLDRSIAETNEMLDVWYQKKVEAQSFNLTQIEDTVDTLKVLADECKTAREIVTKVEKIFGTDTDGVTFCTIHRSKGLECERVFILRRDLIPHPNAKNDWQREQEQNLHYVAITRAKKELYYVSE